MSTTKKAIIVGASSGIGRELAHLLARDGYHLGLVARRLELLHSLQAELGTRSIVRAIDISDPETVPTDLTALIAELDGVDLVIISAGIGYLNPELKDELELQTIATNVTGFTVIADTAYRHFQARGSGQLLAISSVAAIRGNAIAPAYNASKAYVSNYLEGLRLKATKDQLPIAVTEIQAGFVATAMAQGEGLFWVAPVSRAAAQIYHAIQHKRAHAYVTRRWRLIGWLLKILPGFLYRRLS